MRISELRLVNSAGETLGKIVELVLDMRSGRVIHVLVSLDSYGSNEKLFPLPWCALRLDARRQCFVLHLDEFVAEESGAPERDCSESMTELPSLLQAQQVLH